MNSQGLRLAVSAATRALSRRSLTTLTTSRTLSLATTTASSSSSLLLASKASLLPGAIIRPAFMGSTLRFKSSECKFSLSSFSMGSYMFSFVCE